MRRITMTEFYAKLDALAAEREDAEARHRSELAHLDWRRKLIEINYHGADWLAHGKVGGWGETDGLIPPVTFEPEPPSRGYRCLEDHHPLTREELDELPLGSTVLGGGRLGLTVWTKTGEWLWSYNGRPPALDTPQLAECNPTLIKRAS